MPQKGKYVRFKKHERKIKSTVMIYEDFESILVPEDNGKQICNESYTIKKMLLVIMVQLICVNDKFSKSLSHI